jgi:hypothetical protein
MAHDELNIFTEISRHSEKADKKELEAPKRGSLEDILDQRHKQRGLLFTFSMYINFLSYVILIAIFWVQASMRIYKDPSFSILDGRTIQVFSTVVIGQSFGIILVIARAIWNDKHYKGLLMAAEREKRSNSNGSSI